MSKKIVNVYMVVMMIGFLPFFLHCMYDAIIGVQIELTNYCSEIYIFNAFIFAYNFIKFYSDRRYPMERYKSILQMIIILNFSLSTMMYVASFYSSVDSKAKMILFIFILLLAIVNLILTFIMVITFREKDDDNHYFESIYERYSENRYERYLLERIDEKINLIKTQQKEEGVESEDEKNSAKNAEELINGSDILAEMLKNHIEIKEYFKISKKQSKFSFYFSIVSSVVGIVVVIIAASGMVIFKSAGISIIAAVSGAITEIISGIVLWIHNKSALQLNYYYDSLHENEKFLSAVNIADKLSEEKKEEMYIEIIRKQIDIQPKDRGNKASNADKN